MGLEPPQNEGDVVRFIILAERLTNLLLDAKEVEGRSRGRITTLIVFRSWGTLQVQAAAREALFDFHLRLLCCFTNTRGSMATCRRKNRITGALALLLFIESKWHDDYLYRTLSIEKQGTFSWETFLWKGYLIKADNGGHPSQRPLTQLLLLLFLVPNEKEWGWSVSK